MKQIDLAQEMHGGNRISSGRQAVLAMRLAVPAILAQLTNIVMEYIDAAMVGQLGARASASIGLVASTAWLVGGLVSAAIHGFSVQVAHAVGAGDGKRSRSVLRQAITANLIFSAFLAVICVLLSGPLPALLGAEEMIRKDAAMYLKIYSIFLPVLSIQFLMAQMLQCSGDMKTPGIVSVLECVLNIVFNYLLIFPSHAVRLGSVTVRVPGAGLGVAGAALGTVLSISAAGIILTIATLFHARILALFPSGSRLPEDSEAPGSVRWIPEASTLRKALRISLPIAGENTALSFAQVISTRIVAPLRSVAIAANSFAVTAEAFCYMPGYGIGMAATTMVGQAYGAGRKDLARSFAWMTTALGMILMAAGGAVMYFLCPYVFRFLTPDAQVQMLGVRVLRIELFAEPLFAATIVGSGALRGAGDTLVPAIISLVSIWGIRIVMASLLIPGLGLSGVWIAMVCDLSVRGILFLIRLARGRWLNHSG